MMEHGELVRGQYTPNGTSLGSLMRSLILIKLSDYDAADIQAAINEIVMVLYGKTETNVQRNLYVESVKRFLFEITHSTSTSDHHFILPVHVENHVSLFGFHFGSGAQCYVWLYERIVYLIFKGEALSKDFIFDGEDENGELMSSNTRFTAEHEGIKFRHGLAKQLISIADKIETVLASIGTEHFDSIVCTGYDHGGSLATLASVYFASDYPDKRIHCHSFGAPRFGNYAFSDHCKRMLTKFNTHSKSCRVYCEQDDVPCYPSNRHLVHVDGESLCLTNSGSGIAFPSGDHNLRFSFDPSAGAECLSHEQHVINVYIQRLGHLDMMGSVL